MSTVDPPITEEELDECAEAEFISVGVDPAATEPGDRVVIWLTGECGCGIAMIRMSDDKARSFVADIQAAVNNS